MAENSRAHHGQVLRVVCWPEEEPCSQGGAVPVQDHLHAGAASQLRSTFNLFQDAINF